MNDHCNDKQYIQQGKHFFLLHYTELKNFPLYCPKCKQKCLIGAKDFRVMVIKEPDYLFESVTEYDIDEPKRYDMKFGGAKLFVLSGYEGEKIRVRLASNTLSTLQNDFKVKIDDIRKRIDMEVNRRNGVSEATAKETVSIFVQIPSPYIGKIECAVNAETVEIHSLECDSIELDVKVPSVVLEDVSGTVEINCSLDMEVVCHSLNGEVAINQVSATSKIHIPEDTVFTAVTKGIETSISYEKDGQQTETFDTPDAENIIELNGIKSELVICMGNERR